MKLGMILLTWTSNVTCPLSVIWMGFFLWRTSCPFAGVAPLRCLLKASRALYPNRAACPRTGCAIWPSCPGPSAVPVLRRSGLFQENSVTKRVSMPVLEQASFKMILIRTAPTTPPHLHLYLKVNNFFWIYFKHKKCPHTILTKYFWAQIPSLLNDKIIK